MTDARFTPDAVARRAASRMANVRSTRPTTRPGSERTDLVVGDRVRVVREWSSNGTWRTYDGREGVVVVVNCQTFPPPRAGTYVELGVAWNPGRDLVKWPADAWFRADELEALEP